MSLRLLVSGFFIAGCSDALRRDDWTPREYDARAWQFGSTQGRRIVTPHYEIFTTVADERLLETFPELMEAAYEMYADLAPAAREPAEPMQVYLFATRPQWERFTRHFTGPRAEAFLQIRNGGYSERGVTAIQYVSHQTTFPIMAHEGLHQYLYHHLTAWAPAWLNEGMAVACEGQRWEGARLREFDAWHNPVRRNALADALLRNELFPLRELLATHAGRVIRGSTRGVATYYAQLWAFYLFLREGEEGRYRSGLDRLVHHLGAAGADMPAIAAAPGGAPPEVFSPGEAVFVQFISTDVAAVEREYRRFIRERLIGH